MNVNTFKQEVSDFVDVYCWEYMKGIKIVHDDKGPDYPAAILKLEDCQGIEWSVPIAVNPNDDEIAIDIGDAGFLHADAGGLYAYLWHEAKNRITR